MNAPMFPSNYDEPIRFAVNSYLVPWSWLQLKAQLWQESRLDPTARNERSGAEGIAQFMPDTSQEVFALMGFPLTASAFDPRYAIPAAAWYMRSLRSKWKSPRTETELWRLSLASYNAGFGNILEAQKLSGGALDFTGIMAYLPGVTGHDNAMETRTYVEAIEKFYGQMSAGVTQQ